MSMLTDTQKQVFQIKLAHGCNVTDLNEEFEHLQDEVDEAKLAFAEGDTKHVAEGLANVAIYLLGMSEMLGKDLGEEITKKCSIVSVRAYGKDGRRVYDSIRLYRAVNLPVDEQTSVILPIADESSVGDTLLFFTYNCLANYKACKVQYISSTAIFKVLSVVWLPGYEADIVRSEVLNTLAEQL